MSIEPIDTWIAIDWRPMKTAAHGLIADVEAGKIGADVAAAELHDLAERMPGTGPSAGRLVVLSVRVGHYKYAHLVIDRQTDVAPKPWIRVAAAIIGVSLKALALAAFVWFVVWLAR